MAFTEIIKTGRKYRKCIDNTSGNKVFERYSFWGKASDIEFNDGTTVENKVGSFKGVTTNENQTAGYAADVTLVKSIKTSLSNLITSLTNLVNSINDRLGGMRFYEDSTGKYVIGADSVPKKLGELEFLVKTVGSHSTIEESNHNFGNYFNTGILGKTLHQTIFCSVVSMNPYGGGTMVVNNYSSYNAETGEIYIQSYYCQVDNIYVYYTE